MTLASLIERVEKAEAGSRGLDAIDLSLARWLYENPSSCTSLVNYDPPLWLERNGGWVRSLDAALALASRVLPGCAWEIYTAYEIKGVMKYGCNFGRTEIGEQDTAYAPTPALALVLAVLRAKESTQSQEPRHVA